MPQPTDPRPGPLGFVRDAEEVNALIDWLYDQAYAAEQTAFGAAMKDERVRHWRANGEGSAYLAVIRRMTGRTKGQVRLEQVERRQRARAKEADIEFDLGAFLAGES